MQTQINLPFPPSLNGLFANRKGGRRKTAKYEMWIADATKMLLRQKFKQHTGHIAVNIFLTKPDNRRRDLDNQNKAICDLLVAHKIIRDDSDIQVLHTAWSTGNIGAYIIVEDL